MSSVLLLLAPALAVTQPEVPEAPAPQVSVSGYVQPQLGFRYRSAALPRERLTYGADRTVAGVMCSAAPLPQWSVSLHVVLGADFVQAVTSATQVDRNGDGTPDSVSTTSAPALGRFLEEATVAYTPLDGLQLKAGQMRIPFTAQEQSPSTALMFPERSGPNEAFLSGTDLGMLASLVALDRAVRISAGVFNGTGLAASDASARGVLYALRADANLLGPFPFDEADVGRGPLRFGVGAGLLYLPSEIFDRAGYSAQKSRDLRASASLRMAVRGFYAQAEVLRRQRTDDVTSRPDVATGAYAQASYFLRLAPGTGLAPLARFGWFEDDQRVDPRRTLWAEAGAALYLGRDETPDSVRVTAEYLGELRVTEHEQAHGGVVQVQLRW